MSPSPFDRAVESAKVLPASTTDEQKLKIYALYKQAKAGPAPTEGPSRLNVLAFSKWSAWHDVRKMSAEEASSAYVTLVESLSQPTPLPEDEYTKLSRMLQTAVKGGVRRPVSTSGLRHSLNAHLSAPFTTSMSQSSHHRDPSSQALDENPPEQTRALTLSSTGQPPPFGSLRLSHADWSALYGLQRCAEEGPCNRGPGCCASASSRKKHAAWSAAGELDRYEARLKFTLFANRILDQVYPRQPAFLVSRVFTVCFADRNAAK